MRKEFEIILYSSEVVLIALMIFVVWYNRFKDEAEDSEVNYIQERDLNTNTDRRIETEDEDTMKRIKA